MIQKVFRMDAMCGKRKCLLCRGCSGEARAPGASSCFGTDDQSRGARERKEVFLEVQAWIFWICHGFGDATFIIVRAQSLAIDVCVHVCFQAVRFKICGSESGWGYRDKCVSVRPVAKVTFLTIAKIALT